MAEHILIYTISNFICDKVLMLKLESKNVAEHILIYNIGSYICDNFLMVELDCKKCDRAHYNIQY